MDLNAVWVQYAGEVFIRSRDGVWAAYPFDGGWAVVSDDHTTWVKSLEEATDFVLQHGGQS